MTSILELARSRRTVRRFQRRSVGLEDIVYVLETARQAPSGANRQPWRFIVVRDRGLKRRIREECEEAERGFHERAPAWMKRWLREKGITWRKPFLEEAPVLILVFGRKTEPYWVQSIWIAVGYILLALEERGLSTVTYTPPRTGWTNELLGVPRDYILQVILPIGYPGEEPEKPPRLPLSEIAFLEEWGNPLGGVKE